MPSPSLREPDPGRPVTMQLHPPPRFTSSQPSCRPSDFSTVPQTPVQTVENNSVLQNPIPPHPYQSSAKPHFPRQTPTNPHPDSAALWEPCIPRYPTHPLQPSFPLALNSTARFSKTHPMPNPAPVAISRQISTFPATTGTTAGTNNSFLLLNSHPYPFLRVVLLSKAKDLFSVSCITLTTVRVPHPWHSFTVPRVGSSNYPHFPQ